MVARVSEIAVLTCSIELSGKAQEEEDEGLTPDTYPAVREPISVTRADQTQELEELRRKALSARKQVNAVTT